jgi:hypothetical protein
VSLSSPLDDVLPCPTLRHLPALAPRPNPLLRFLDRGCVFDGDRRGGGGGGGHMRARFGRPCMRVAAACGKDGQLASLHKRPENAACSTAVIPLQASRPLGNPERHGSVAA